MRRRGLTYLEVIIVVVILGVMAAVTLPNMRGPRESAALRSSARDIASAGLLARQLAVVHGEPTRLLLNKETGEWQILTTPPPTDDRELRRFEPDVATTHHEQRRTLPQFISFGEFESQAPFIDDEERHVLTFYPNGSSTGLAIQVKNTRGASLTIDFEENTGRPEVYEGEPKTVAEKLREHGIDPLKYGLADAEEAGMPRRQPGEGFYRAAGMTSDERVEYYKDAVERMMKRSQNRYFSSMEGGPAAHYSEAQRWGSQ